MKFDIENDHFQRPIFFPMSKIRDIKKLNILRVVPMTTHPLPDRTADTYSGVFFILALQTVYTTPGANKEGLTWELESLLQARRSTEHRLHSYADHSKQ